MDETVFGRSCCFLKLILLINSTYVLYSSSRTCCLLFGKVKMTMLIKVFTICVFLPIICMELGNCLHFYSAMVLNKLADIQVSFINQNCLNVIRAIFIHINLPFIYARL